MTTSFEDLEVFQVGEELADRIWNIVMTWKPIARDTVGKQLIRSADGVGANIAEGVGRFSHADNLRFIRYARGSAYETKRWLMRAISAGASSPLESLLRLLNGYMRVTRERVRTAGKEGP